MKKIIVFFQNPSATTSMGAVKVICGTDAVNDAEATAELFFRQQDREVSLILNVDTDPAGMLIEKLVNWETAIELPLNENATEIINAMYIRTHSIATFVERFNRNSKFFCNLGCSMEDYIEAIEVPADAKGIEAIENAVKISLAKGWFVPKEVPVQINDLKILLKVAV